MAPITRKFWMPAARHRQQYQRIVESCFYMTTRRDQFVTMLRRDFLRFDSRVLRLRHATLLTWLSTSTIQYKGFDN